MPRRSIDSENSRDQRCEENKDEIIFSKYDIGRGKRIRVKKKLEEGKKKLSFQNMILLKIVIFKRY